MNNFMKNSAGMLVIVIIVLALVANYVGLIVTIATIVLVTGVSLMVVRRLLLGPPGARQLQGGYCQNCGHNAHGRQDCHRCRCQRS